MKSIQLGQKATRTRTFERSDVEGYEALTMDRNPAHRGVIPGPLIGALFSDLLGTELPGRGTNWMKQKLRFVAPAYVGAPLTAEVEVVRLRPDKDLVNLRTLCFDGDGRLVCEGEALVMTREMA